MIATGRIFMESPSPGRSVFSTSRVKIEGIRTRGPVPITSVGVGPKRAGSGRGVGEATAVVPSERTCTGSGIELAGRVPNKRKKPDGRIVAASIVCQRAPPKGAVIDSFGV